MPQSRILPVIALALLSVDAHSLGIGEIVSQPRLGDRLRIEVRLLSDDRSPIDPACVRLAPGDNSDDLPWVRGARLRVQGGARPTLVIESNEAINHPIYLLGLRVGCGAEVKREFTLMPQPPVELPVAALATPVALAQNTAPNTNETSGGAAGWMTIEGETLSSIAGALFPIDTVRQKNFIREAARANPRLFRGIADPAQHPLPGGASLALPGTGARQPAGTPAPRPTVAKHRPANRSVARGATRNTDVPPATAAPKSTSAPNHSEDRLSVAAGTDSDPGLKFSTLLNDARSRGLTEEQRERLRQEQRLVAELDEKIIASLALAEKIRNMEGYLDKLQGDMAQLDQKIQGARSGAAPVTPAVTSAAPVVPAATAKAPTAHPAEDDSIPWQYPLLAAAAGLVGWLWWRRRGPDEDSYFDSSETTIADDSTPEPSTHAERSIVSAETAPLATGAETLSLELDDLQELDHRVGVAEHDSALELAEIMLSFGRVQGAAQTLSDYIQANPRQAIRPWLKLLEVYSVAGMRADFETVVEQFHRNFNVQKISWDDYTQDLARTSLEDMPHLVHEVISSWGSAGCLGMLQAQLHDNRDGTRTGFALGVVDDIATLIALLEAQLDLRPAAPAQAAA